MDKIHYVLMLLMICVIFCCFILGTVSHCVPISVNGKATIGQPYYFEDSSARWGEITDYAICDNIIYVLYEEKEILDCYSTDGTYLHSYSLVLGEKGKSVLYTTNDVLNLKDRGSTFYTFNKGFFADTYEISTAKLSSHIELLTGLQQSTTDGEYVLRGASLWQIEDGISKEIVHRPGWMALFQGNALLLVGPICFIALCAILYYYKKQA